MEDVEAYCGQCGKRLDGLVGAAPAGAPPRCPECGCTSRTFRKTVTTNVSAGSEVTADARGDGKDFAIRRVVGGEAGRAASADIDDGNLLRFVLQGPPQQGEENTEAVCRILVSVLNKAGAEWCQPRPPSEKSPCFVDCLSEDRGDPAKHLRIQVVRADVRESLYRELNDSGRVGETELSPTELVTRLEDAIKHKESKIPPADRAHLMLALDATWLPALVFNTVIDEFRSEKGLWAGQLGFEGVWVVGPTEELTRQLDVGMRVA